VKVPKSLCLGISGSGVGLLLTLKRTGRVATADGKRTFYLIAGEVSYPAVSQSVPVSGSGHLAGDVLHFSLTGSDLRVSDSHFSANHHQASWDLVLGTGQISNLFLSESSGPQVFEDLSLPLVQVACDSVPSFY
jgi:hypothetical protein